MSQGIDMNVNTLPSPTWNWLHMNETKVSQIAINGKAKEESKTPASLKEAVQIENTLDAIAGGMGEDMESLAEKTAPEFRHFTAPAGVKENAPVMLAYRYQKGEASFDRVGLTAEENSEMTVVMDFGSEADTEGQAAVQTKLLVKKNARIHLIQLLHTGESFTFLNDVGALCEEGANVELLQLVIGGKNTYLGIRSTLIGAESSLTSDVCYLLDGEDRLDMNYVADHRGKRTVSNMEANGVLRGSAHKLFRGTIDFKNGSGGSKGDEKEDVLLFSDQTVNRTIPLILCQEEDVEGNHGATIGRLDEELLFYLESRGIPKEDVSEMMARARVEALCKKIQDPEARALARRCAGLDTAEDAPVSENDQK